MRYVIAFFFPWLSLILQGKIGAGILCLILQLTLIGWLPATIWAIMSLNNMYADRRTRELIKAMTHRDSSIYTKDKQYLSMEEKARLFDEASRNR